MSKEIITYVNDLLEKCIFDARGRSIVNNEEQILLVDKAKQIIKALTPPTAEEVCEALSEYLKEEVFYEEYEFYIRCNEYDEFENHSKITHFYNWKPSIMIMLIEEELPPTLAKMVCWFYESEVNK